MKAEAQGWARVKVRKQPLGASAMNYIVIDIHQKYSVASVQDERGQIPRRELIEGNRVEGFRRCLGGERARAVIEASWNCTKIYEILEELEGMEEVVLATWNFRNVRTSRLSWPERRADYQPGVQRPDQARV
jgi:hypothetical protein